MPPYFEIDELCEGDWLRLTLTGELDLASVPVLRHRLAQLRAEKHPVRLDLSSLDFMDSSGLHLLIGAFDDARNDGWRLAMDPALSPQVRRLFRLADLDHIIAQAAA